jgi:hypothetical protein
LKNHAGFLKTAIEVYRFFHIFGISIENWSHSYIFRIFLRTFFFVEKCSSSSSQGQVEKWIQSICRFYCLVICHFVLY